MKIGETLAREARPILQLLGVWEEFKAAGHLSSLGKVSAWGNEQPLQDDFIYNPATFTVWRIDGPTAHFGRPEAIENCLIYRSVAHTKPAGT